MPRKPFNVVCVAATQPSPYSSTFAEQAEPRPAATVMIPVEGLITWRTLLMSSPTKTLPKESTSTPARAAAPKMPLTARQPSPNASVDFTPEGRFGHCVPELAVMGASPPMVVMVYGSATGVCAPAFSRDSVHITGRIATAKDRRRSIGCLRERRLAKEDRWNRMSRDSQQTFGRQKRSDLSSGKVSQFSHASVN